MLTSQKFSWTGDERTEMILLMPLEKVPQHNLLFISGSWGKRVCVGKKGNLCSMPVSCRGGKPSFRTEAWWIGMCWLRGWALSLLQLQPAVLGQGQRPQHTAHLPPPACACTPTALGDPGIAFLIPGLTGCWTQRYKSCAWARLSLEMRCCGFTVPPVNSAAWFRAHCAMQGWAAGGLDPHLHHSSFALKIALAELSWQLRSEFSWDWFPKSAMCWKIHRYKTYLNWLIFHWDIVNYAEDWNPPYTHACRILSPLLLCELHLCSLELNMSPFGSHLTFLPCNAEPKEVV